MAPEQAFGDPKAIGPWSDIFAIGAILYELLTGQQPFAGGSADSTLRRLLNDVPETPQRALDRTFPDGPRPNVPPALEELCMSCLEKNPTRRPASAEELGTIFEQFLSHTANRPR